MPRPIPKPSPRNLLTPLFASLPAAAVSAQPPTALLPLLSPTLRQRIQFLSSASHDTWLPLLCYDQEKAIQLMQIGKSDIFEPHPVSGEVEVDWDGGVETRYLRIDEETLEAHVLVQLFELSVKLLWCIGDQDGGGDGWRIGQVNVLDISSFSEKAGQGCETIEEAESLFMKAPRLQTLRTNDSLKNNHLTKDASGIAQSLAPSDEEEDDDAYWAQYDSTPARTPAPNRLSAPTSAHPPQILNHDAEDTYYAQYASVQPAMDAHDPDEVTQNGAIESTLGQQYDKKAHPIPLFSHDHPDLTESSMAWNVDRPMPALAHIDYHILSTDPSFTKTRDPSTMSRDTNRGSEIAQPQPRPTSSNSSSSASMIVKLENTAAAQVQAEVGIKQHISTSIKSMFRLARAVGVGRVEFERLVMVELECLSMMEEDEAD